MAYTYAPRFTGSNADVTPAAVHAMLKNPNTVAKRVSVLADHRFIADTLLAGRYVAQGGGILYEADEPVFASREPESIAAGAAYPRSETPAGELLAAETRKWGLDAMVTDEAIARLRANAVDKAMNQIVNSVVRTVDAVAMSVISSKVTQAYDCSGTDWSTGMGIVRSILAAKAALVAHNEGFDADLIVMPDLVFAAAMAELVGAGVLPRDGKDNPLVSGTWPEVFGVQWISTPNMTTEDPLLLDSSRLGGMADEILGGPGYARLKTGGGIDTMSIREDNLDRYVLRARRVVVPVVTEPRAAIRLVNTEG